MQTREQVIKGLECISGAVVWCAHCSYSSVNGCGRGDRCKRDAAKDAIAMLKAQEPRVMTLEEVRKTPYTKPIYLELLKSDVHMALISPIQKMRVKGYVEMYTDDEDVGLLNYEMYLKESYGKTWRCWTSRPTDAQREATLWED